MYRIVQEALNNATRHGGAHRAHVEIVENDSMISLTVRDDGHGFDPLAHTDGFGLIGMRERVELLNGTLNVTSSPGKGTSISATFPVRHRIAADPPATEPDHPQTQSATPPYA
jgi:signal transduction histidine kinase